MCVCVYVCVRVCVCVCVCTCVVLRTHLAPALLQLKAMGVDNVLRFNFLSVSVKATAQCFSFFNSSGPLPTVVSRMIVGHK